MQHYIIEKYLLMKHKNKEHFEERQFMQKGIFQLEIKFSTCANSALRFEIKYK